MCGFTSSESRILHNVPCARFARHGCPSAGPCSRAWRASSRVVQRDRRLPAGARAIVQRGYRAFGHRPLDAALDRLMVQPERLAHRKKRRVFPITQQDARALDPARRFGSRPRYHPQLLHIRISERQFNRPPPRCHIAKSFVARPSHRSHSGLKRQMNPTHMTTFLKSVV